MYQNVKTISYAGDVVVLCAILTAVIVMVA